MAILLPTTRTTVTQGQTSEFAVTNSAYGETIPFVIGTQRLAGNVIWADDIREERAEDVQTTGGKGSPKQETTTVTFRYYVDLAIAFAEGPITALRRMWADGKIIYDNLGASVQQLDGLSFTLYTGTEDQQPDPIIEAAVGENLVPAHRGIVYIVFNDFPLANFGNRIPAITAEFAFGDEDAEVQSTFVSIDLTADGTGSDNGGLNNETFRAPDGRLYYSVDPGIGITNFIGSSLINSDGSLSDPQVELDENDGDAGPPANLRAVSSTGTLFCGQTSGGTGASAQRFNVNNIQYDLNTSVLSRGLALLNGSDSVLMISGRSTILGNGQNLMMVTDSSVWIPNSAMAGNDGQAMIHSIDTSSFARPGFGGGRGAVVAYRSGQALCVFPDSSGNLRFYVGSVASLTLVETLTPAQVVATETGWTDEALDNVVAVYDSVNDQIIVSMTGDVNGAVIFSWTEGVGINWVNSTINTRYFSGEQQGAALSQGSTLVWTDELGRVTRLFLSDGSVDPNFDGTQVNLTVNGYFENLTWDEASGILYTFGGINSGNVRDVYGHVFLTGAGADISARTVITEVCERAGLSASEIDVSNVGASASGTKSFLAAQRASAANLLQPFLTIQQIDPFESDGKLQFRSRGSATATVTVSEDDFISTNETGDEPYIRPRIQETDLPLRVEVNYDDSESQYQEGMQSDERATAAVSSRNIESYEHPGAMTPDGARQRAQRLLYEPWSEQERLGSRLPWRYLALDPTDVITLNLDNGDSIRGRLRQADIGADLTVDFETVVEAVDLFTSDLTGSGGAGNIVTEPTPVGDSDTFIFDTPLLRDGDAATASQTNAYWSGSGVPTWNGVLLYRQDGDTLVTDVGKQLQPIPFGVVVTPPPDATQIFRFADDESLVVRITRGTELFASITELDVLNGGNVLLIVKANGEVEFLQFQNVAVDGGDANLLTLSRLLRGRRGTDTMANGIAANDQVFLMLSATYINAFKRDSSTLNAAATYRGVTVGQIFEEAETQTFTDTGRDLKPYSVTEIGVAQPGGAGTDLTFTWTRRTRIGGDNDLNDGVADVPLSEDSESYDLVTYTDNTYTTEQRVINVTSETATYTAAQITADGNPSTIFYRIFQRSATVGRGFSGDYETPRDL